MGTDIHVVVERRTSQDQPWTAVALRGEYERLTTHGIGTPRPLSLHEVDAPDALTNRNYDVFALLADVRNGRGFAGILTGDGWTPIAEPRGIPEDATTKNDNYQLGDHSFSYATVAELIAFFDTPQTTTQYGVLSLEQYAAWLKTHWKGQKPAPKEYCGGISGGGVRVVEESAHVEGDGASHVRVSWPETALEAAGDFYTCVLPWLTALAVDCGPDNVRLVFGFDS